MVKQKDLTTCITYPHASHYEHRRRLKTKLALNPFFFPTASLLGRCLSLLPTLIPLTPTIYIYRYVKLIAYSQLPHLKLQLNLPRKTSSSIHYNESCLLFILFNHLQASTTALPPLLTPLRQEKLSQTVAEAGSSATPSDSSPSLQSRPHQLS